MTPRRALEWSLAALAFAAPLSIAGANAALAALTLSALWAWTDGRERPRLRASLSESFRSPAFLLLGAGFAWYLVASAAALEPAAAWRLLPRELHKLWCFAALCAGLGLSPRPRVLRALAAGLAAHAGVGLYQALTPGADADALVRAHGFVHPVTFGALMGLGFVGVAAYLARTPAGDRSRPYAAALAALTGAAVALNQTRAVALALGAAALACAAAGSRPRRALGAAALALVAVLAFWEYMPTGGRNLRTLFSHDPRASGHKVRLALWDAALTMGRERPLTGVGPGGYKHAFERAHPAELDPERSWGSAHNAYLHQLAERGVPGLLLFAGLLGAFALGGWRAARERGDSAGLWALGAAAGLLFLNLTENAWQTEQTATFFLFCWLWGAGPRAADAERL